MTAIVAGTAPPWRTWLSSERAVARFSGYGMPCVMIVLSSATTGNLPCSARRTSGLILRCIEQVRGDAGRGRSRFYRDCGRPPNPVHSEAGALSSTIHV